MAKAKKTPKVSPKKHPFEFSIPIAGGKPRIVKVWCKVRNARKRVELVLTEAHVLKSMAAKGVGNTQNCSMAVCGLDHADRFPHPVIGFIDWQYRTAYVVSRLDRDGWPCECWRYDHADKVARFQDNPGGQKALLARIRKNGGQLTIVMRPYKQNTWTTVYRTPGEKEDGSRKRSTPLGMGAKRRFAVAFGGRLPPEGDTIDNSNG